MALYEEHPFAQYIRILGKGRRGSRGLTQDEAYTAMRMIMADEIEPMQLGAFLMLMRVKEETPEELAGTIQAVRDSLKIPDGLVTPDLDWSSYAGKRRQLPWFLLSALLLADRGYKVFMHGSEGHTEGRIYTREVLQQLGVPISHSFDEASQHLRQNNFSYLPLSHLSPMLQEIIELRPMLGLRSPVHTIARMINPLNAPYLIQGIFHPTYRDTHQEAAVLLNMPHMAVFKGEGGEIERNPDTDCLVKSVHDGVLSEENWPARFATRHLKDETMEVSRMIRVWRGDEDDEYARETIITTTAIALALMQKAATQEDAVQQATALWEQRSRERLSDVA